jgi:epoxyqueuosine reductase QueG
MDLAGVAAASALAGEPAGHRPADLLPGAKSVIVYGRALADGAVQAQFRALEEHRLSDQSAYAAYAGDLAPNILLVNAGFEFCCWLEETFDAAAALCPFNVTQSMIPDRTPGMFFADPYGQGMPLDIWKAAMAAGLGEYGWSNRFLTPDYGPRQMLCAVVTTLELDADAPYAGPALCDPSRCGVCAAKCPTHAIPAPGGAGKTVAVVGKTQTVADLNANACTVAALGLRREFSGWVPCPDLVMNDAPTDEELTEAFRKKPINGLSVEHYPRYLCDRCLIYCPVGRWKERFADTGLTHFTPKAP